MKTLSHTARLFFAAIAVTTTLALFSSIVSIAEPQRSELMAKNQRIEKALPTTTTLALASNDSARTDR